MKYKLIAESNQDDFETAVNTALLNGWDLYGSPCCGQTVDDDIPCLMTMQAMIRDDKVLGGVWIKQQTNN